MWEDLADTALEDEIVRGYVDGWEDAGEPPSTYHFPNRLRRYTYADGSLASEGVNLGH
jgi:hypothetical protein